MNAFRILLFLSFSTALSFEHGETLDMVASNAKRPLTIIENQLILNVLKTTLAHSEDECFVNISVFKNVNLVKQVKDIQKQYLDQKSKNKFLETDLAEVFPFEDKLPGPEITFIALNTFKVSYPMNIEIAKGNGMYPYMNFESFQTAQVEHWFKIENQKLAWIKSTSDVAFKEKKVPHVRCQQASRNSIFSSSYSYGPKTINYFLDLELVKSDTCQIQCGNIPIKPLPQI